MIFSSILRDTSCNDLQNCYFFSVNSEATVSEGVQVDSHILREANPNTFYNYYCILSHSYHKIVRSGKKDPKTPQK